MYCFFALMLLMPSVRKPSLKEHWSNDQLVQTPVFGTIMSQDRFLLILRLLHFSDNENANDDSRTRKIDPILTRLNEKFSETFKPFKNVWIDESFVLWKGRLIFRQYIPSKRARFGIKLFMVSDCETGYVLNIKIYSGNVENPDADQGLPANVVMHLMEPYYALGHCLFLDNWYVSPTLFKSLLEKKINACGTVRSNRKGLPKSVKH